MGSGIHPFNSPLAPPSNRIRSFEFWAFTPNPSAQNPKQKTKLKFFFRAIPIAIGIKVKHAHHITRHIWLRLLYKSLHPYLPPLRYGKHQICRYIVRNFKKQTFSILYLSPFKNLKNRVIEKLITLHWRNITIVNPDISRLIQKIFSGLLLPPYLHPQIYSLKFQGWMPPYCA